MKKIIAILIIFNVNISLAFDGVNKGVGLSDRQLESQLFSTSIPYAIARQGQRSINKSSVQGFYDLGDSVFSISSKLDLIQTRSSDRDVIGTYLLTRWPHETILPEITTRLAKKRAFDPEPTPVIGQRTQGVPYTGCLSKTPLRYGDVDSNSSNELVILADKDIVFFSVGQKKIIFQLRWIDERYSGYFDESGEPIVLGANETNLPQYHDAYVDGPAYKGLRAYAKLYLGEFNSNQTRDILVWYKVYESNMNGGTPGFNKVSDTFKHYELITTLTDGQTPTGEYLPMNTSTTAIQQWLTTANLTWQKGYPSQSECVGQENQLIPEMHDPLLNDPDVLK